MCSGVVSLRSLRLVVFFAELNDVHIYATGVGNAYLEKYAKAKSCIIAEAEFGDLKGHTRIIVRALCGLRISGATWHDWFADCLRKMGFVPSRAEPEIWMRLNEDNIYEYIDVYVDDLAILAKDPVSITNTMRNVHKFKLKETGEISYHLGMDFITDDDLALYFTPVKYINKIYNSFYRLFGHKPTQNSKPYVEKNDHPELDTSQMY